MVRLCALRVLACPKFRSESRGDLHVHVEVKIPTRVSKGERAILERLADEMGRECLRTA